MSGPQREQLGAQAFLEQLVACGVRYIFGNPGTTEQTVVDYIQDYPELQLILALHEGVAVGAADGYARASGELGVVELHAGPGLGNGIGHLYNAYVSHTPMLIYVGQSEQQALYQEPVLSADLVAMARPVTKWAHEVRTAGEIPQVVRRAAAVATTPPCGPVLLSIPLDLTNATCTAPVIAHRPAAAALQADPVAISQACAAISAAQAPLILVGDAVAASGAIDAVAALARLIGAPIFEGAAFATVADTDNPLYGGRLPGDPEVIEATLAACDAVVAIGTRVLAQVFPPPSAPLGDRVVVHIGADAWELGKNQPSTVVQGDERVTTEALVAALSTSTPEAWRQRAEACAARIRAERRTLLAADRDHSWSGEPMSAVRALYELGCRLPGDAVVIDEAMSSYEAASRYLPRRRGSWFRGAGGIGTGLPMALGAKVAHPSRRVVAVVGDGASLYSLTGLWTAAHHGLAVIWVILANRSYRTLKQNTLRGRRPDAAGHQFIGADLADPVINFSALAASLGVQSSSASTPAELSTAIDNALEHDTPALIEVIVSGEL